MNQAGEGPTLPRSVWRFGAAAVVCAMILAGVILYIHDRNLAASRESVAQLMLKADEEISGGFYLAAIPYLDRAMRTADTRGSWLSIAKRAYEIASATGNYGPLLQVATKATASLPGAQQLWAIKVLAEARGGNASAAETTAARRLNDSTYRSFATEAILRAHPDLNVKGQTISARDRRLIDILTSRDPALFESLAAEIHSQGLAFDAALLYAWKGDMKAAVTLLLSQGDSVNPEAGMLVSYDAGNYEGALSYFEGIPKSSRSPEFQLLADDILVEQRKYDEAALSYEQFIRAHPDAFWMPYVDLAWLATTGKSSRVSVSQAVDLLKQAAKIFPDQREVVLALATIERERGDLQAANSLLSAYLKAKPTDVDANLLFAQTSGASQNPQRLGARLWELFYAAKGAAQQRAARFLTSYLLGIDDYHAARLVFRQLPSGSDAAWIPFYRGIGESIGGAYSSAVQQFAKAFSIDPQWQALYNMAVVELAEGDAKAAALNLQKADSVLSAAEPSSTRSPERAAIHVALAQALEQMGNLQAAKREALYARDMDPNSLSAALLLKKLDSAGQK